MHADSAQATNSWDGTPLNPEQSGWHLLRWTATEFRPTYEEAWYFDPNDKLPWERRENGVRYGWLPEHMGQNWAYVGRLMLQTV
jgi:hypothetical protein